MGIKMDIVQAAINDPSKNADSKFDLLMYLVVGGVVVKQASISTSMNVPY